MKKPYIHLRFEKAQNGFWDGGPKLYGDFIPERCGRKVIKWGSYALNYWFTAGFGHSWKHAAGIAKRRLHNMTRPEHILSVEWR